jgi:hypothetical protein
MLLCWLCLKVLAPARPVEMFVALGSWLKFMTQQAAHGIEHFLILAAWIGRRPEMEVLFDVSPNSRK